MSDTRTAVTADGTVEYETVDCASCGTTVPKDAAVCECAYCRDDPAGFPTTDPMLNRASFLVGMAAFGFACFLAGVALV